MGTDLDMTDYEKMAEFLRSAPSSLLHFEIAEEGLGFVVTFFTEGGSHITLEYQFDEQTGKFTSTEES